MKEAVYQRKSYNSDEFEQYGNQSGYEEGDMLKQLEGKDIITLDDNKEIISAIWIKFRMAIFLPFFKDTERR